MKKIYPIICLAFFLVVASAPAAEPTGQRYGPVREKETLFRIALKFQQPGITVAQLMMSIFEANPGAFHRANINRLKVGVMLVIPSPESIARLDRKQALRDATGQIDSYESEVRDSRIEAGEIEPLADAPRDPDLSTGVVVAAPDEGQIEEIKRILADEQQQIAGIELPEPKPSKRKRRKREEAPLFRYSYDVALLDDDNIRLARDDEDIREDSIFSAKVKARAGKSLDSFTILNYGASVTYNRFETFEELDNVEFEANIRYRFALSSGFSSPIYALGARIGGIEFESEMRDSTVLSLNLEMSKWLTNTLNLTVGLGLKRRESVSEVYDLAEARVFANLDTNLGKRDLVYTTLTYISGDTVSSATPTLDTINAADAIEPDDAFGGIDTNQFAYRIDADTLVATLGYNRILTGKLSLDLSARFVNSEARDDDDVYYERTILRASLLGRF